MSDNKEKLSGTVVFFDPKKGWGFCRPDNGKTDHFVHYSNIKMDGFRALETGQRVVYELQDHPKRPMAVNVEVVK